MLGIKSPILWEFFLNKERATSFGRNPSLSIVEITLSLFVESTFAELFITLETVAEETPASFATSLIVTILLLKAFATGFILTLYRIQYIMSIWLLNFI